MAISKKQKEILEYVKNHILTKGFPPAVREICEAVHLKSTSSVHFHLAALEENGFIRRDIGLAKRVIVRFSLINNGHRHAWNRLGFHQRGNRIRDHLRQLFF